MRTLGLLTIVGLLTATACSSADPGGSIADPAAKSPSKKHSDDSADTTPAPAPAPTPAPRDPVATPTSTNGVKDGDETDIDCGGTKAPHCIDNKDCKVANDCLSSVCTSGRCKAPAAETHYCQQLGPCCNTLASTFEKLACTGIQFAGKEGACQAELVVCGIGGIGGTPCGNLTKCCDQMQTEGYGSDALACRGHNTGNASTCTSWYSQYQRDGWCD